MNAIEKRAFMRGYRAGIKTQLAINVKNQRLTVLAGEIMNAAMRGEWGVTKNGKFEKYNLKELEDMVVASAHRLVQKLVVFKA